MTISRIMLQVRRNGHGKDGKPVVFPKLVYLYDERQIEADVCPPAFSTRPSRRPPNACIRTT